MKRPFVLFAAPLMLGWKSATLFYMLCRTDATLAPRVFLPPLAFLLGAGWLFWRPRLARWIAGAFFAYAAIRGATLLFEADAPFWVMVRRPFSTAVAGWFAWFLLAGAVVRAFVAEGKKASQPLEPPPDGVH